MYWMYRTSQYVKIVLDVSSGSRFGEKCSLGTVSYLLTNVVQYYVERPSVQSTEASTVYQRGSAITKGGSGSHRELFLESKPHIILN